MFGLSSLASKVYTNTVGKAQDKLTDLYMRTDPSMQSLNRAEQVSNSTYNSIAARSQAGKSSVSMPKSSVISPQESEMDKLNKESAALEAEYWRLMKRQAEATPPPIDTAAIQSQAKKLAAKNVNPY